MKTVPFDLLVSSDLGRAASTASSFRNGELSAEWREFHIGEYEGESAKDIRSRYPELAASGFGIQDFHPEGGERFTDFMHRVEAAFASVADRLDDGQHAVVVTHGGVIQTLVGGIIGTGNQPALAIPSNASLTTILLDGAGAHLQIYNDDVHLNGDAVRPGGTRVDLIRHGQTEANLQHRWWGRGETPLTARGREQAEALAATVRRFDGIVSSPLSRAVDTARPVAEAQGRPIEVDEDMIEISFGTWEGLTPDQIRATDPELFTRVFEEGIDEPKGTTG